MVAVGLQCTRVLPGAKGGWGCFELALRYNRSPHAPHPPPLQVNCQREAVHSLTTKSEQLLKQATDEAKENRSKAEEVCCSIDSNAVPRPRGS